MWLSKNRNRLTSRASQILKDHACSKSLIGEVIDEDNAACIAIALVGIEKEWVTCADLDASDVIERNFFIIIHAM